MALRVITGRNGSIAANGDGEHRRNGNGNGNGSEHRNGNGVDTPPAGSRTFIRHLRELIGETVTVATTCGMVRGELGQVHDDYILIRHNGTRQNVRLSQICFVSVERNHQQ